jgi:hypothetical protein
MAIRFIDEIDKFWHFGTSRLATVGLAISAASPMLQAWDAIPDAAKAFMPDTWKAAMPLVIIFAALLFARATTTVPAAPEPSNAANDSAKG